MIYSSPYGQVAYGGTDQAAGSAAAVAGEFAFDFTHISVSASGYTVPNGDVAFEVLADVVGVGDHAVGGIVDTVVEYTVSVEGGISTGGEVSFGVSISVQGVGASTVRTYGGAYVVAMVDAVGEHYPTILVVADVSADGVVGRVGVGDVHISATSIATGVVGVFGPAGVTMQAQVGGAGVVIDVGYAAINVTPAVLGAGTIARAGVGTLTPTILIEAGATGEFRAVATGAASVALTPEVCAEGEHPQFVPDGFFVFSQQPAAAVFGGWR